ncbi:MAG TPA: EamA family transporter [Chloroflexota bacterium]|jgi:transporter family protein|nr:EamA family transporter [Chloroflexota bacterium]
MPSWVILGLLSALSASLVAILGRLGLQSVDPTAATTARSLVMTAVLGAITVATGRLDALHAADGRAWLLILASGAAGAASWLCYFAALRLGQAGPVSALDRLSLAFTVLLAAPLLGEPLTPPRLLGTALVLAGAYLIAAN